MKRAYLLRVSVCLALGVILSSERSTPAATISGDLGSTTFFTASDLVSPGFFAPGTPTVQTDAFTFGRLHIGDIYFSVDRGTIGLPGTSVFGQATFGPGETAHADVFRGLGGGGVGSNALVLDGDGSAGPIAAGPVFGLFEGPVGSDDIDALEVDDFFGQNHSASIVGPRGFWSVDGGTIAGDPAYALLSPADIFDLAPFPGAYPTPGLYATAAALGLVPGDDIDALEVLDVVTPAFGDPGDLVLFSLAPGSPTDIALGTTGGFGGDIFAVTPGGPITIFRSAADLGLGPGDNINGITAVPEPGMFAAILTISGIFGVVVMRRRRRQAKLAKCPVPSA